MPWREMAMEGIFLCTRQQPEKSKTGQPPLRCPYECITTFLRKAFISFTESSTCYIIIIYDDGTGSFSLSLFLHLAFTNLSLRYLKSKKNLNFSDPFRAPINPNRSLDFSRIACNCRADFFCVLRRRSGLRQVKDKRKMCGKGMQSDEELNQNTLIRSNDRFGIKCVKMKRLRRSNYRPKA